MLMSLNHRHLFVVFAAFALLLGACGGGGGGTTSAGTINTPSTGTPSTGSSTTRPTVTIISPTSASSYVSGTATINLGGTVSDNVGVTQVTWSNSGGGAGTASGTGSWTISNIALQSGTNIITVTALDSAGNTGSDTITVSYSTGSIGGVTYYVATNGSDTNDGRSLSTPFQTIAHAKSVVNPGDTIEIRGGTYTENNLLISRVGAPNAWITMRAYNKEQVILRSTGVGPTLYFYHNLCDGSVVDVSADPSGNTDCQPLYWIVQGLTIQGSPNGGGDGYAIKIDTPDVKVIANRLCCTVAGEVKLPRTANDVEILNNEIWHDASIVTPSGNAQGIDIVGADRTRIAYNYVHDINDIGMYAKGNARNTIFENNRLVNIGYHGIMLGQATGTQYLHDGNYETYDGIVRNNIVIGTGWACVATSSSFNVHIYNNSCYNTGNGGHASILISNESDVIGGWPGTNIEIKNNIIYGAVNSPMINISNFTGGYAALSDDTTLHMDKNIYYVSNGAPQFYWYGTTYDFAQWQTIYHNRTTQVDTSLVADPQYASTTMLTLNPSSPAIDAGVNTVYVTTDYNGTARPQSASTDIGAYEY
jgi:hypothetical protein